MTGPKIGVIDIETTPIEARVWQLYDVNISIPQIVKEWSIMSFVFKELGSPKVEYLDTSKMADPRDDYELCGRLWEIIHEYDFLVAQNGKRFDLRKIKARLIMHGFPPPSPVKVLDTMLMARQVAAFTSNKLEWLSAHLAETKKDSHKEFPGFEMWNECLAGNPKAWRALKKYNIPDVISTEELYVKIRPWVKGHGNLSVYTDGMESSCPVCLSTDVTQDGFEYTQVGKYVRFVCGGCGAWSRGRRMVNTPDKRRIILSS